MGKIYQALLVTAIAFACQGKVGQKEAAAVVVYDEALAMELEKMVEVDQIAANVRQGEYKEWSTDRWQAFKDSVFKTHQVRVEEIFDIHGFPGFDLVGEKGSQHFWLMVQHSDHDPEFQEKVLGQMEVAVANGNANPSNYGLLVDRVNLNTGKPQIYGTQVTYNMDLCQAYPRNLADSANVNERRKSIGLPPLEEYLNMMSEMHFEMNKASYVSEGITAPKLYPVPQ